MRKWSKPDERREAVRLFVDYLHKAENKGDRDRCTKKGEGAYAKKLFAKIGEIDGIPDTVEFHVYEKINIEPRDSEYAILLLPDPTLPLGPVDVTQIYRCTWDPWSSLENQSVKKRSTKRRSAQPSLHK